MKLTDKMGSNGTGLVDASLIEESKDIGQLGNASDRTITFSGIEVDNKKTHQSQGSCVIRPGLPEIIRDKLLFHLI